MKTHIVDWSNFMNLAKSKGLFITSAFYISLALLKPCVAMEPLSDEKLSNERAQSILGISYIGPGEDGNPTTGVNKTSAQPRKL